jgi:hypothetical protein
MFAVAGGIGRGSSGHSGRRGESQRERERERERSDFLNYYRSKE